MRVVSNSSPSLDVAGTGFCDIGYGSSILIQVTPGDGAGVDDNGNVLHPVLHFPLKQRDVRECDARVINVGAGWRDVSDKQEEQLNIECDAGSYYFPIKGSVTFRGGVGEWTVYIAQFNRGSAYQGAPLDFWLTTAAARGTPVTAPPSHTSIQLLRGQMMFNGILVAATVGAEPATYPISNVNVLAGSVYRTGGRL